MQRIVPHLWYDKEAAEAAELYVSLFEDSGIKSRTLLKGTPSGTAELLKITLAGQDFMLLSAGPYFKFTPAVSFLVACETPAEVDRLYGRLASGRKELMPLGAYPFSERYVWLEDKYGLSWQIMHFGSRPVRQKITPTLMFVGGQCGKAEEAVSYYASLYPESSVGEILRYGPGEEPDKAGSVRHVGFTLSGQDFAAMDSAHEYAFSFNEAASFVLSCANQEEIDRTWERLSARPEAEQCGWLKDRYGLSWQIVPAIMNEMMQTKDPEKLRRVTEAFLKMKKFDLAALNQAFDGTV